MSDRPDSHDFLYVHTDIPAGMTIRDWRALRAANRIAPRRRSLAGCRERVGLALTRIWRAGARALARPRMARVRVLGGRHRAPRPAAPPSPGVPA